MSKAAAETLVLALGVYLALGLIVGLCFVFGGAGRIDPAAKGTGLPFRVRLMILPGLIGLWPLMLIKLVAQKEPPVS